MGLRDWLMLFALAAIWGTSFFYIAIAVTALPPFTLAALRVTLAALCLSSVAIWQGTARGSAPGSWRMSLAMGLLNNVLPFTLVIWAQRHIPSGLAAIVIATTPLFGVLLAGVMLADERITRMKMIGVVVGLGGIVVMSGSEALRGAGRDVAAIWACLAAAVSFALAGVLGKRFKLTAGEALSAATAQAIASSLLLVPLALGVDAPWTLDPPAPRIWFAVIALGVVSTAIAYLIYFRILASAGATNLLLVNFLVPIPAILLGTQALNERFGVSQMLGLALVGIGLSLVDGRLWRRHQG